MNYNDEAKKIIEALGGEVNIDAMTHCATRLRMVLNDEGLVDEKTLSDMDIVKGTFSTGGQYQIIIGTGTVNTVFNEMSKITGKEASTKSEVSQRSNKKMNPIQQFVKMLSDIFVPIIPAIVAGGLLMGINNLLVAEGLFYDEASVIEANPGLADLANMIDIFANAPFVFLPILIGFSATRRFGGNPYLGAALGMLLVHPALMNGYDYPNAVAAGDPIPSWDIFSLSIEQVGYQGQVLPILVASWILAKLEIQFRKIVPSALDIILTPLFSLFITGFVTFLFVGPLTRTAGDFLSGGLMWLYDFGGPVGAALFGLFYAPIVITGMHHSFIAIETQLIANQASTGGSFIFPIASMSNVAQGAAALAVFVIIKGKKMKGTASAAGISALLGITEPAMFGVNLKLRYPFIGAIIGSAVGAFFVGLFDVKATALGAAAIPGIISIVPTDIPYFIISIAIAIVTAFAVTFALSRMSRFKDAENE
ncbi:PTS sucrose transporter subunit IIBC [Salinicoccus cyprini]|jgi:PTS system sucrose-specific IIC component|uniref:protein-N(pi)-phosphohistidine--sucrose phosphotransferase n=1 Tax=Salinicoccus cyprini TaxID=2493691 RepID=A0A558ARC6_9STAP|nr:sucrose-specific PTS transporter subunit IIBC [Salinicoccus cyprini]TVT26802.1 PTS sucrose transporter subunit IIBC [Salinicoccus cyprini]